MKYVPANLTLVLSACVPSLLELELWLEVTLLLPACEMLSS